MYPLFKRIFMMNSINLLLYNVKQNCTIHRSILKSKAKHTTLSEQFEHSIEQSSKQRKN